MMLAIRLSFMTPLLVAGSVVAADMLPLRVGIYVPGGRPCKGASNTDIVNYLGGRSAIGVAQATCTIKKLTKKGNAYTLMDECKDIQSGDVIEGGPTVLTIQGPTSFMMSGMSYRYCGPRPQL